MKSIIKTTILGVLCLFLTIIVKGQDLVPGLYCNTDHPVSPAPLLCSMDSLNMYMGVMPDSLYEPQPTKLCDDGGNPNNMSWFAFVAGSTTIDLTIIPSNCAPVLDDDMNIIDIGIQAGIFTDCTFEERITCATMCTDVINNDINLVSDQFVIGQTYHLFVDGCAGSVCDYQVQVNTGDQAFEMPEITTISTQEDFTIGEDTLCQGGDLTFVLDSLDLEVGFSWEIAPATTDYPLGVHPEVSSNIANFTFSDTGYFTIYAFGFNDCDANETDSFSIYVEALQDEYFEPLEVCVRDECLPLDLFNLPSGCVLSDDLANESIFISDPNEDGVIGWQGTDFLLPGMNTNEVTNAFGCSFTQYLEVLAVQPAPPVMVDYYACDFPTTINGINFGFSGDSRTIRIPNAAGNGCDSIQVLTAYEIDLDGNKRIGDCDNGNVSIYLETESIIPSQYDEISYTWFDSNGDEISDSDGIDSVLMVTSPDTYSVVVEITKDGVVCTKAFAPWVVDIDNLSPVSPNIIFTPQDICVSEGIAKIYVENQGLGENYTWNFDPVPSFSFGVTADTIYVDVSDGVSFDYCVFASNGCGSSTESCESVNVIQNPSSDFTIEATTVCVNEPLIITYTGGDGMSLNSEFSWDFGGGVVVNGADILGPGPFEVSYVGSGNYTVSLSLSENGCDSEKRVVNTTVVDPFIPPIIECEELSGAVLFTWDEMGVLDWSTNLNVQGYSYESNEIDSLWVTNLESEEAVTVEFSMNESHPCGAAVVETSCTSLPCPEVQLTVQLSAQDICLDEEMSNIELNVSVNGSQGGNGEWESPFIVNDNEFDVISASYGVFPISYQYIIEDCSYRIDTSLSLFSSPVFDWEFFVPTCEEEGQPTITVLGVDSNRYFLNEMEVPPNMPIEVDFGEISVRSTNGNGCGLVLDTILEVRELPSFNIVYDGVIIKGNTLSSLELDIDSEFAYEIMWFFNGDTICTDCDINTFLPSSNGELCGVLLYGVDCFEENCLDIVVVESTILYVPNVFSPNSDGVNDYFEVKSNNLSTRLLSFQAYDRWGNQVANLRYNPSENTQMSWDGFSNGKACTPGVYVYSLEYLDEKGEIKIRKGSLTIVY